MSCTGLDALNPLCIGSELADGVSSAAGSVASGAFESIARSFGMAAASGTAWLWEEIDSATSLDLTSSELLHEMSATGAIAGVLCLILFTIQLIKGALWRDGAALQRAVTGLMVSFLGSALALGATRVLISAVDALCAGLVQRMTGGDLSALGNTLIAAGVYSAPNPATLLMVALAVIIAVVVLWATLMVRKLLIIVAAVLAPFAFAGAAADLSRAWVRRWIEFVAAMIVSKLLLVIILSIGVMVLQGGGSAGTSIEQTTTQAAAGLLVLTVAAFSPWMAIKMFTFVGESMHVAHVASTQSGAGARAAIAAPQKVAALHASTRSLSAISARSAARSTSQPVSAPTAASYSFPRPATTSVLGGGHGAGASLPRQAAAAGPGSSAPAQPSQPISCTPEKSS